MAKKNTDIPSDQPITAAIVAAAAPLLMAALLYAFGRVWWCECRDFSPYVHEAWNSSHTSQHLFDPYTFTHILHGIILFWITTLLFSTISNGWRFAIAVWAESAWEVLENTNFIIEKYRENTASLDYFGDSIANSAGDLIASAAGFLIAVKLGWRRSLIFFLLTEIMLLLWIRDSLILNLLMLIYPLEAVRSWQMGI